MMNHIILSGAIALSIFATSASAETARWTGFQFGVSLGESTVSGGGHTLPASSPIAMAASLGNQAGTTGIRVGYNWGLGDNFVLGVGGSYHRFQGAGGGSPEPVAGGPNLQNATTFGALVGYSFGNTMVFLEGGAADG